MSHTFAERARGALLGLALGDAYGRSLEFVGAPRVYGKPVRIPSPDFNWTDDTHMSLYLIEALTSLGRAGLRKLNEDELGAAVGAAFVRWAADPLTPTTAPGNTCLAGAAAFRESGDWRSSGVRRSDGCGAVMRIAPLPVVFRGAALVAAARVQAVVTHAHPNAPAAAVAGSLLLRDLLEGEPLNAHGVQRTANRLRALPEHTPTVAAALEAAIAQAERAELPFLDEPDIPDGDGGWRSPSALGLALVAALRWHDDPALAIEKAARIEGDSDSVACLTGMLLGAVHGPASFPQAWLDALPMRAEIERSIDTLLALVEADEEAIPAGARTSASHPIRVDWVAEDLGRGGRLGLTFAPGKRAPSWQGEPWHRDLGADLDRLREGFGVDALVSLVEEDELGQLGIPELVGEAEARGIGVIRLPIPDGGVPSLEAAAQVAQAALSLARSGRRVVFHCRGGLGRAGTLAASTLLRMGLSPEAAIQRTRAARPGAIENAAQERFIGALARHMAS